MDACQTNQFHTVRSVKQSLHYYLFNDKSGIYFFSDVFLIRMSDRFSLIP